jgi:aminopeptidase-like protein
MPGVDWQAVPGEDVLGAELHALVRELYPICRSITGDGVRETFAILTRTVPLEITETPSGTQVFDWTLPREWNIRDAWIADAAGERVVDFRRSNLHVLGYSVPVRQRLSLADLRPHLHTHPENPDWVPFRTSYYNEDWGFCLSTRQLEALAEGEYEVVIDSTLSDGHVTYAEALVPGQLDAEVLFTTYSCHPSLCNDNLSGVVVAAALARYLRGMDLRYTYRFVFGPGTIGPLTWLWRNEATIERVRHGIALSCLGDPAPLTYKRSRHEDAEVDQAAANVLRGVGGSDIPFNPLGGDERQFASPGFDLPVGALTRSPADRFPGYHSSADDLDLVRPAALADSLLRCLEIVDVLESNGRFRSLNPKGEPQLGRRGLYRTVAGGSNVEAALLWALNQSDGSRTLLEISDRSGLPFRAIRDAAEALATHGLLERVDS